MKKTIYLIPIVVALSACSTPGPKRVVVEASGDKPEWAERSQLTWERDDFHYFMAKQTVRGDQRESACKDLASLDNREHLLKAMADEVKGAIDNAVTR